MVLLFFGPLGPSPAASRWATGGGGGGNGFFDSCAVLDATFCCLVGRFANFADRPMMSEVCEQWVTCKSNGENVGMSGFVFVVAGSRDFITSV